ncbi:hypothetical protein BS78_01G074200 [Paspalum vaginatum]|nr:hypothetical protein BS78_01G074200 [Paspalum vaginatum]
MADSVSSAAPQPRLHHPRRHGLYMTICCIDSAPPCESSISIIWWRISKAAREDFSPGGRGDPACPRGTHGLVHEQ